MSKHVVTVRSDSKVQAAIRAMAEKNIGSLVVEDEKGPVGVFTERDLLGKVLGPGARADELSMSEVTVRRFNTVPPDQTIRGAAGVMTSARGRLTVFDKDILVGIVTASDIVRAAYRNDLRFYVDNCITKKVVTVGPGTDVETAIRLMDKKRIGSVLIEGREGGPSAIFTERDMLKFLVRGLPMKTEVRDVSSSPLITGQMGLGGHEAAGIMVKNKIKRLPLKARDDVIGILTARDIVRACAMN